MGVLNPDIEAIVKQRLEQKFANGQLHEIYQLDARIGTPRKFTPEDIIAEVRAGTPVGEEFMIAEYKVMQYLKSKI